MEHKQQIIGTDGRMLGEQGKERQYTSRRSGGKEQREIDSPKRFLPAYAVDGGGCGQYKKEQGGLHRVKPSEGCSASSLPVTIIFSSFSTKGRVSPSLFTMRAWLKYSCT